MVSSEAPEVNLDVLVVSSEVDLKVASLEDREVNSEDKGDSLDVQEARSEVGSISDPDFRATSSEVSKVTDSPTKGSKDKDSRVKGSRDKASKAKDFKDKVSQDKDFRAKASRARASRARASRARAFRAKASRVRAFQGKDSKDKDFKELLSEASRGTPTLVVCLMVVSRVTRMA